MTIAYNTVLVGWSEGVGSALAWINGGVRKSGVNEAKTIVGDGMDYTSGKGSFQTGNLHWIRPILALSAEIYLGSIYSWSQIMQCAALPQQPRKTDTGEKPSRR